MVKSWGVLVTLSVLPVLAQESASFKLTEHVFNAGGHPSGGTIVSSASFRVTVDSIGEDVDSRVLAGPTLGMEGGFVPAYPPPGEIKGLRFTDVATLVWDPDLSVGDYNLYRELLVNLSVTGFGSCEASGLTEPAATDTDLPSSGACFVYVVTSENRLAEEGTKGFQSDETERGGTVCP